MAKANSPKRARGRPKGAVADQKRDVLIQVKVFREEREAYVAAMRRSGLSTMSEWIRFQLNKVVQREAGE